MSDRLRPQHLQRQAIVYIRQSSPGQVKNHPESYRVQKGLVSRALALGWSEDQIRVVQGDQGTSTSLAGNRQGFDEVLQSVQSKQVGIVLGQDASRLARNSLDWALMTHSCALHGQLLGDQAQVLDPALPQDSLVLGIQGTLAVHEINTIRQRLGAALRKKASRGELHHGVQRGYVLVDGKHLRKHPDRRVQQAIARRVRKFPHDCQCRPIADLAVGQAVPTAAAGLQRWLGVCDGGRELHGPAGPAAEPRVCGPVCVPAVPYGDNRVAGWYSAQEDASHTAGRMGSPTRGKSSGLHRRRAVRSPSGKDRHERATLHAASRSSANQGRALLSGLIECRRCHHKLQVHYDSQGRVTYFCQHGKRQRDRDAAGCIRLAGEELERQLSEQVLYAVSPAGVQAALLAGERLATERDHAAFDSVGRVGTFSV